MNYYFLKYADNLSDKFGGEKYGPLIKIRPKHKEDPGLLVHQKTHVRQWYTVMATLLVIAVAGWMSVTPLFLSLAGLAPFGHQLLYRYVRSYRRWCEVRAYHQIAAGGYTNKEFAVNALVEKYDLGLNINEARALLSD
ncbi:hypothetical protein ACN1C3_12040 [Pseudomonas sp. H11T01]|uniref:hypothetical protein n=1 Tax=Pseudomonas sp. H11T01 TaxID=3402749 RepID=UPI003AC73056